MAKGPRVTVIPQKKKYVPVDLQKILNTDDKPTPVDLEKILNSGDRPVSVDLKKILEMDDTPVPIDLEKILTGDEKYVSVHLKKKTTTTLQYAHNFPRAVQPRLSYPSEYKGFIHSSSISAWYDSIGEERYGHLILGYGGLNEVDIPITFLPGDHTILRISSSNPSPTQKYWSDWVIDPVNPEGWGYPIDTDLFDNIKVEMCEGNEIRVSRINVILNRRTILSKNYDILVDSAHPLYLADDIRDYRLSLISYSSISRRIQDTQLALLKFAANDLGQAWDIKYCPWNYDTNKPYNWCTEYIMWLIHKKSRRINLNPGGRSSKVAEHLVDYFRYLEVLSDENIGFITAANVEYAELGEKIRPGFYAKINRSGHSTLFVGWVDKSNDEPPFTFIDFDPNNDNYFLSIGGNQRRANVNTSVCSISESWDEADPPSIIWSDEKEEDGTYRYTGMNQGGELWDESLDGFGDTSLLLGISLQAVRIPWEEIEIDWRRPNLELLNLFFYDHFYFDMLRWERIRNINLRLK